MPKGNATFGQYVGDIMKTKMNTIAPYKIEQMTKATFRSLYLDNKDQSRTIFDEGGFYMLKIANYFQMFYLFEETETAYSLFRLEKTQMLAAAEFDQYKVILKDFIDVAREIGLAKTIDKAEKKKAKIMAREINKDILEKVCAWIKDGSGWTCAHMFGFMKKYDAFKYEAVRKCINLNESKDGYTPLHISVLDRNFEYFKVIMDVPEVFMGVTDNLGNSPLSIAICSDWTPAIEMLRKDPKSIVNIINNEGMSVARIACISKKPKTLELLLHYGANPNNFIKEVMNNYPIHDCFKNSAWDLLVKYYPKHINATHGETGETVLFLATDKKMMCDLCQMGINVNAQNKEGNTVLHMRVNDNNNELILELLLNDVDAGIQNNLGNTALHLAMRDCDLDIMRALIVFEVPVNVANKDNETARHVLCKSANKKFSHSKGRDIALFTLHAVGAKRCDYKHYNCSDGCKNEGGFDGVPPNVVMQTVFYDKEVVEESLAMMDMHGKHFLKEKINTTRLVKDFDINNPMANITPSIDPKEKVKFRPGLRLIAFDGGGIKGLVLAQVLRGLERICKVSILECFDWLAGTSTGGIFALFLLYGYDLRRIKTIYFKMKDVIFVGKRPYLSEPFEKVLKDTIGEDTMMDNIKQPKIMIPALLIDRFPPKMHAFRNYEPPLERLKKCFDYASVLNEDQLTSIAKESTHDPDAKFTLPLPPHQQRVWLAARATGAAPTFFTASNNYVDGGLVSNNPTMDLISEVVEYNQELKFLNKKPEPLSVVVSIGTGRPPFSGMNEVELCRFSNPFEMVKSAIALGQISRILIEQATSTEDRVINRARAWCSTMNVPYFRFCPHMASEMDLDTTDTSQILQLLWEAEAYVNKSRSRFELLAQMIVKDRK